jgi:hypothetical protein
MWTNDFCKYSSNQRVIRSTHYYDDSWGEGKGESYMVKMQSGMHGWINEQERKSTWFGGDPGLWAKQSDHLNCLLFKEHHEKNTGWTKKVTLSL